MARRTRLTALQQAIQVTQEFLEAVEEIAAALPEADRGEYLRDLPGLHHGRVVLIERDCLVKVIGEIGNRTHAVAYADMRRRSRCRRTNREHIRQVVEYRKTHTAEETADHFHMTVRGINLLMQRARNKGYG
jgi:hypothetical protein